MTEPLASPHIAQILVDAAERNSAPAQGPETDWQWCYENPKEAAATLDAALRRVEEERIKHVSNVAYLETCCRRESERAESALRTAEAHRVDKERLDALQAMTKGYGSGWILMESSTGRGMRLHETSQDGALPSVRAAIDTARTAARDEDGGENA